MALSGSFTGSIVNGNYKLKVDWSATQSVANNTSKITCVMYLVQASSWSLNISSRSDNKTTIGGTSYTWASPAISNSGGKTTKLATVTSGNIAHNADGSKSVTISATFNIEATISGTFRSTITASKTVDLNTIPRATRPSLSSSSVNMGSSVTISLPRASSRFTHDLSYELITGSLTGSGGVSLVHSGTIATGAGASYAWTVPDLASHLPDDTQATAIISCVTKNGSTRVGTKTVRLTVKVPTSVVPTVGALAIEDATAGLAAQFGAYIQGKSKLKVSIAAVGAKGSTITAYSTTLAGKTYTGSSFTSSVLTGKGSIKLVTKVKDSRGRWSAGKTTTVTLLAYNTPQITRLAAYRVNSAGNADEEGTYLRLDYAYSVTSLGGKNTASALFQYKRSVDDSWTNLQTLTALSANTSYKPSSPTFSIDSSYDFRMTVTDWFGASRTYMTVLPSGAVVLDIKADGKGIAFGKVAEAAGIDFGWGFVDGVKNMGSQVGQWKMPNGPLVQWGIVSITPTAVNTPTSLTVNYVHAYTLLPCVFTTPVTSVPQNVGIGVTSRTTTSIDIELSRSDNLTTTIISWLAIGLG